MTKTEFVTLLRDYAEAVRDASSEWHAQIEAGAMTPLGEFQRNWRRTADSPSVGELFAQIVQSDQTRRTAAKHSA